jgi:hypothetical protein
MSFHVHKPIDATYLTAVGAEALRDKVYDNVNNKLV